MFTEVQKQILRISSSIPVFHNSCGRRTTFRQCNCNKCTKLLEEIRNETTY